ncbi:MAG: ARPP-1 family domain-containing protein [Rubrobacteraceae bacterium]
MLSETLRGVRVGSPVSHGPLHLFPLTGGPVSGKDFALVDEAFEEGSLRVEELRGGSIPELRVVNGGTRPVLILEGDELVGFKQDRVVNSSVLVEAASERILPVSCIEQGRWSRRSKPFSPSAASSPPSLRKAKSRSVAAFLRRGEGHRSDQGAVWEEVDRISERHAAPSPTRALRDTRSRLSEKLAPFEALAEKLPADARGVVAALGGRAVSLEMLAGPRSFSKVSRKLISGYALEALEVEAGGLPDPFAVREFIETAASAEWEEHPAVGAGRDFRFEAEEASGYALVDEDGVSHLAVFAAYGGVEE